MFCWPYLKRNIIFRIIFLLLISLVIVYNLNFLSSIDQFLNSSQKHLISCYFEEKHDNSLLELNPEEVTKNSIFFVETSCNHKKGINLSLRQGCAIESAANLNPNLNIFVLFVAPSFISDESEIINRFKMYSNVNLRYINFVKYSHNTPLQDFVASNTIATSQWPVSHASDLLRFLTLWKFGGTYLDLDVVLMKSLEGLSNFASIESNTSVASLVLNFDVDKIGRTVSNTSISDFATNYYANDWGYNGPGVITRTLEKICNTNLVTDMNKQKCQGFMVFGTEAFCPISWTDWRLYFNTNTSDEVMVKLKDSIGIHVWNLHSKHTAINIGSKQPYGLVAEKYCPIIFSMANVSQKTRSVLVTTPIPLETFEDQHTTTPGLVDSGPAYLSPWMILLLFAIIRDN